MILVADSGSTKVSWRVLANGITVDGVQTVGINPFFVGKETIVSTLNYELKPHVSGKVDEVFFYGAGVAGADQIALLEQCFQTVFPGCRVEAVSDLLAAARCLCGHNPGIAAILGTGSNSCFYDGKNIVDNVSAAGFILGDEGGGAYLGKHLLSDYLKRQLPKDLRQAFDHQYQLSALDIIEKVYRQPMPNRFLASFSPFIGENRSHPYFKTFLAEAFDAFFKRNIAHYDYRNYSVHLVGSVAYYYKEEVTLAAQRAGMRIGRVEAEPIDGLVAFHSGERIAHENA